jgi:hypothetical protein
LSFLENLNISYIRYDKTDGITMKIKGFNFIAWWIFSCIIAIKALVSPQPGHSIPKILFHRHGIRISMENTSFKKIENRK